MSLRKKLDQHYRAFDRTQIKPDPLEVPHRYDTREDIELSAFIASIFAFGNVNLIIKQTEKILQPLGKNPYNNLLSMSENKITKYFSESRYRFYSGEDVLSLLRVIRSLLKKYGTIEKIFMEGEKDFSSTKKLLSNFSKKFLCEAENQNEKITRGIKFMFPDPETGGACKRMNLFLRWMVRNDDLDFGLWNCISPAQLIIPVDTHIAKISRQLGLTKRKIADWKMAEEITTKLKKYDAEDPVKYDFALCHISMRGMEF